jgi:hypothetical protein
LLTGGVPVAFELFSSPTPLLHSRCLQNLPTIIPLSGQITGFEFCLSLKAKKEGYFENNIDFSRGLLPFDLPLTGLESFQDYQWVPLKKTSIDGRIG